jgi:RimJ/RimL family protein N-acetyltransferase
MRTCIQTRPQVKSNDIRLTAALASDLDIPSPAILAGMRHGHDDLETGRAALAELMRILAALPRTHPWADYWAVRDGVCVGLCGFKSALDDHGAVEIGYGSFPRFEGQGVATAMASGLVELARAAGAAMVFAHTLPRPNGSGVVLTRNGFVRAGEMVDPEDGLVWRWELRL